MKKMFPESCSTCDNRSCVQDKMELCKGCTKPYWYIRKVARR